MTVQEAIKYVVKEVCEDCCGSDEPMGDCKTCGVKIALECMQEVEQYRALGTVEELKEAREKQVAKKIKVCKTPNTSFGKARTYYVCPNCGAKMCCDWKHCFECGQALKWGDEDD